jgi:hypothetical protein
MLSQCLRQCSKKQCGLCEATFGNIYRWDGEALHLLATHNTPPAFAEARSRLILRPGASSLAGRMLASKAVVHIADVAATLAYEQRVPETVAAVELGVCALSWAFRCSTKTN